MRIYFEKDPQHELNLSYERKLRRLEQRQIRLLWLRRGLHRGCL